MKEYHINGGKSMKYNGCDITWVWVDLDDTLIDFKTNSRTALTRLYHARNLDRWFDLPEKWIEVYELHNKELWSEYAAGSIACDYLRMERFRRPLTDAGVADEEARILSRSFDMEYLDYLAAEKVLMPGALKLLAFLRGSGVKIGVLSNGFADVQYRKIRSAGLEAYIDLTVLSDDIGINKPDRRLFEYAMQRAGDTDPAHHLMIGDNPSTDIQGALGAGWQAILYAPAQRFAAVISLDAVEHLLM